MIRRAAIVLVLVAFIGCSSDSKPAAVSSAFSSTLPASTTTATTVPETIPLAPAATPDAAATTFVNAWHDNNRIAALTIALPAAVDAVFTAGDPGPLENRGCNHPQVDTSPVLCVYKTNVGELQVRLQPQPAGWIVDQAIVSPA